MSADVMAMRTSVSCGTSIFGPSMLQAARHSASAPRAAPANDRFIAAPIRSVFWARMVAQHGALRKKLFAQPGSHVARDERHAVLAHVEAPRVLLAVDADVRAGRHGRAGIDDRALDGAARADTYVGE